MNKELYKLDITTKIEKVIMTDESVTFECEDKNIITLTSYHDQDCCEHVYADFSILKYHAEELTGKYVTALIIKGVDGMGFLLCFGSKIFIPCYNSQNGYYSDSLSLKIKHNDMETTIDLKGCIEDDVS